MHDITLYGHLTVDRIFDGFEERQTLGAMANMWRTFKQIAPDLSSIFGWYILVLKAIEGSVIQAPPTLPIGTLDIDSIPPPIVRSDCPLMI